MSQVKDRAYDLLQTLFLEWKLEEIEDLLKHGNGFSHLDAIDAEVTAKAVYHVIWIDFSTFYLVPRDPGYYAPLLPHIGKRFLEGAIEKFLEQLSHILREMGLTNSSLNDDYYMLWQYEDDYYIRECLVCSHTRGRVEPPEDYMNWLETTVKHYFDRDNDNEDLATFQQWFLTQFGS